MRVLSHLAIMGAKVIMSSLPQEAVLIDLHVGWVHRLAELLEIRAALRINLPFSIRHYFALVCRVDNLQVVYEGPGIEVIAHRSLGFLCVSRIRRRSSDDETPKTGDSEANTLRHICVLYRPDDEWHLANWKLEEEKSCCAGLELHSLQPVGAQRLQK